MLGSSLHSAFVKYFLKLEIYLNKYCTNVNTMRQLVNIISKENFAFGDHINNLKLTAVEVTVHFCILIWKNI